MKILRLGGLQSALLVAPLIAVAVQSVTLAEPRFKVTVEAGKYTRIDTPVSLSLDGLPTANLRLEEIRDSQRISVPSQIESGQPQRLWWILSGKTPAGAKRTYEIVQEEGYHVRNLPPGVRTINDDRILEIRVKGEPVLQYNHAPVPPPEGADPIYTRSGFIHPLWSPKGTVLTDMHPPDHIHHFGIWMPWTKTEFEGRKVDFWNLGKGDATVRFAKFLWTGSGPVYGGFRALQEHVDLKAPEGEKVAIEETWDVRAYNVGGRDKGIWLWDLTSTQRCAGDSPIRILKYHYSGLGLRASRKWTEDGCECLTSEGRTRKDGNNTRARWGDVCGRTRKGWAGVTVLSHPQNLRHPEPMRIWNRAPIFFGFAPPQLGDWEIEPGENYVFRYRFYVHEGKIRAEDADRIWSDFAEPPRVEIEEIKGDRK